MKHLKACVQSWICFGLLAGGVTMATENAGEAVLPSHLTLIFEDRLLTLDFQTHPELLQQTPLHYVVLGAVRYPVSFGASLPPSAGLASLETDFVTTIDSEALHQFFKTTSVVNSRTAAPVKLSLSGDKVHFSGQPTTGHYEIDESRLVGLLNEALQKQETFVRVPAERSFAPVAASDELVARGIESVVAIGRSNFEGSSDARVQNILAAARKFNGLIIPEGRTFSFNHTLGSVDEADGFVPELVIKGNETEKELGGGVCQVSTTVYRAAFTAGLPIVDRRNHSYAVPYYKPHGLDATIYLGGQDLRFTNDTPGDIVMQAFVQGDDLYFVFYGQDDGRKVAVEGPFISQYSRAPEPQFIPTDQLAVGELLQASPAHDGFAAEWVRRVWKPGEETSEEVVRSWYRPWAAKIWQGVDPSELVEDINSEEPVSQTGEETAAVTD